MTESRQPLEVEVLATANEAFAVRTEGEWTLLREPEDDGAPCCRAQVTAGRDSGEHEPGCYAERPQQRQSRLDRAVGDDLAGRR